MTFAINSNNCGLIVEEMKIATPRQEQVVVAVPLNAIASTPLAENQIQSAEKTQIPEQEQCQFQIIPIGSKRDSDIFRYNIRESELSTYSYQGKEVFQEPLNITSDTTW